MNKNKTKKYHPTACKGLNKTNCIFPCNYIEGKMKKQYNMCRAKIQRMRKNAKTEKQKKMLEKKEKKMSSTFKKANKNMKQMNANVKKGVKEVETPGIMSSITGFFTAKKPEETAPKKEEEVVVPPIENMEVPPIENMEVPENIEPVVEEEKKEV